MCIASANVAKKTNFRRDELSTIKSGPVVNWQRVMGGRDSLIRIQLLKNLLLVPAE